MSIFSNTINMFILQVREGVLMPQHPNKRVSDREARAICCTMCADFMTSQGRSETAAYWHALTTAEHFVMSPHADLSGKDAA